MWRAGSVDFEGACGPSELSVNAINRGSPGSSGKISENDRRGGYSEPIMFT